jgi:hypothetical protein
MFQPAQRKRGRGGPFQRRSSKPQPRRTGQDLQTFLAPEVQNRGAGLNASALTQYVNTTSGNTVFRP